MQPVQTFIAGGGTAGDEDRRDPPATASPTDASALGSSRPVEGDLPRVAYLSPEFGVSARLAQYAGGLGVLAGDHLKAADALGVPVVGVGLFYDHGYFTQRVDADGTQHADYPRLDPVALGLTAVDGPEVDGPDVEVDIAGERVGVRVWRTSVGAVPLLLLDTDVEGNDPAHRRITDRLYGGGPTERLRQELVLGVGGVRALESLGMTPEVFHLNEGHAGFSLLERLRRAVLDDGLSWEEAIEVVRASSVFTTHTPVPAGIDRFDAALVHEHLGQWCAAVGVSFADLMALGGEPGATADPVFNMAALCLRLCGTTNGVSQLHGAVSRAMFAPLWPGLPPAAAPIGAITNGVDATTWTAAPMAGLLARHLGPGWATAPAERWATAAELTDAELWEVRTRQRADMIAVVRQRLAASASRRDHDVLDPEALTIGFARRFATYKRAALLTGDPDTLAALVGDPDRPVQFVFAGKAHPADDAGQALIAAVIGCARDLGIDHRIVFVEDYDMDLAAALVSGCDVWLNTPVRPMEACGTSGMKAVLNGGLNCSIPDGWWDEWGSDARGWVVRSDDDEANPSRRDTLERESVFEVLETSVVPAFFDRDAHGLPHRWLDLVRASLAELGPRVVATRMLRDYVARAYLPAARRTAALEGDGVTRRVELRHRLANLWPAVAVTSFGARPGNGDPDDLHVSAEVVLGDLRPDDVVVEAVWGPVDAAGEFRSTTTAALAPLGAGQTEGTVRFGSAVRLGSSGAVGVTARVVPRVPAGEDPAHWGLWRWAQATSASPSSTA